MPRYRILRLTATRAADFRDKGPEQQAGPLRTGHYEPDAEVEAGNPYAVWKMLQDQNEASGATRPLGVGDVLVDTETGGTLICKYWGFDAATWLDGPPVGEQARQEVS